MSMDTSSYGSRNRSVTAFYDSHTDAEEAVSRLRAAGFDDDSIRMVQGTRPGMEESAASETGRRSSGGFWDSLADLFLPDPDRDTYAEGLSRGGYLVTAWADNANYETALDILDDEGTVDIDERAESWRSEGWTGSSRSEGWSGSSGSTASKDWSATDKTSGGAGLGGGGAGSGMAGSGMTGSGMTGAGGMGRDTLASGRSSATDMSGSGAAAGGLSGAGGSTAFETGTTRTSGSGLNADRATGMGDDSDAIPLAKEELRVGKRDVSHGRVRVRSYVVEEPVEASVGLRSERVDVERRPVDRPASGDLFRDRTIEATEHAEEPVVTKDARVTEELVLNKSAREEQRTVSDTVRRTEVEIEDDRGATRTDGTRSDR